MGRKPHQLIQIQVETEPAEETVPTVEVTVPTIEPAETVPTEEKAQEPAHETICTDVDELRICIPQGLADNLVVSTVPEFTAEMGAPWDVAPRTPPDRSSRVSDHECVLEAANHHLSHRGI